MGNKFVFIFPSANHLCLSLNWCPLLQILLVDLADSGYTDQLQYKTVLEFIPAWDNVLSGKAAE